MHHQASGGGGNYSYICVIIYEKTSKLRRLFRVGIWLAVLRYAFCPANVFVYKHKFMLAVGSCAVRQTAGCTDFGYILQHID